ncbi:MAG: DUF3347 domain-containing protein [Cytophagaceae bacterium]|nr:DUF3347 domain-containing protein [Cytophagaceae bacterium]
MNAIRKTAYALGLSLFSLAVSAQNTQPLLTAYYDVKDALVATDGAKTKAKAADLLAAIGKVDATKLSAADKKALDAAKTEASHIGESTDVEHQREHFNVLSKNVIQLTKTTKPAKTYVQFCPMAAEGKGAYWLSDKKAIRNPYYGAKMLTCGKVTEEI